MSHYVLDRKMMRTVISARVRYTNKIISFNVIMNNVFILTITGIGPTNKVDRQFTRIIFLVVAMVLWMSWLLGLELTLLV